MLGVESHLIDMNLSETLKGSNEGHTYLQEAVELFRYVNIIKYFYKH